MMMPIRRRKRSSRRGDWSRATRACWGAGGVQCGRHRGEFCRPKVSERQEGPSALCVQWRRQMERSKKLPLDDGIYAELRDRRLHLREIFAAGTALSEGRDLLSE